MELQVSSFFIILPFFLFILMVLRILKRSKSKGLTSLTLPPGPWKLPVVGSLHHLLGSLPHHRLRELSKKYGPIMYLQLGEIRHIVISSAETAEEVMKTHDINFADRPPFLLFGEIILYNRTDIAVALYGEYWRQLRKVCVMEVLSAKRVQSFGLIRKEEALNLNKFISSSVGSPINLSRMLFSLTYRITTRAAFGKLRKEEEKFVPIVEGIVKAAAADSIANLFPSIKFLPTISGMKSRLERLHQDADRILEDIISEHRARKGVAKSSDENRANNIVDILLNLQDNGDLGFPLTTNNIKAIILDLFVAGTETSSTALEWAMSEMLKHPRVMEKAQAEVRQVFGKKGYVDEYELGELKFMKMVIKETLRLHPPLPLLLPRACREQCEISGYQIPSKSVVLVNAWAIGRDSNYWTDAERFIPERFLESTIDYKGVDFVFIPFGAGRRMCPGISFGIASVELPLANLLFHFDWELPNGMKPECLDTLESYGAATRRKNPLHVTPILRHPLPF